MAKVTSFAFLLGKILVLVTGILGHGRLYVPPGRSTMWRAGYKTEKNYDDNQLFCGGREYHFDKNYTCGVCGDKVGDPQPRENEAGGRYGKGIIVSRFRQGQIMTAVVQITASHKGYFEFRICPTNDPKKIATHACLNRNILQLAAGGGTKFGPITKAQNYTIQLRLPNKLTCSHCVLQWKYHTGNSWGTDPDGTACVGCGWQEEFYGCADIAISVNGPVVTHAPPPSPAPSSPTPTPAPPSPTPDPRSPSPTPTPSATPSPTPTPTPIVIPTRTTPSGPVCKGSGLYMLVPGIDKWCMDNCFHNPPFCPQSHCKCTKR